MDTAQETPVDGLKLSKGFVAAFLIVAAGISALLVIAKDDPGEQVVYTKAAVRLVDGEQIYRPEDGAAFTYPPFFAMTFVPLAPLGEPLRRGVWYFANITMLAAIVLMLVRSCARQKEKGKRKKSRSGSLFTFSFSLFPCLVIVVLAGRYVISPVEYQGHDLVVFLLAMLAIDAWAVDSNRWAGFWAGLAAACKATPLLFLPIFVLQRRFAAVIVFVIALTGATLLPDLLFPKAEGGLWVTSWYEKFIAKVGVGAAAHAKGAWRPWNLLNQSLAGTTYRLATPVTEERAHVFDVSVCHLDAVALKAATTAAQLAVVGFLAFVTLPVHSRNLPQRERAFQRLGEGGAVLSAMLLLSPMSSKQHFCTLLVPITFCVVDFLYRRRDPIVAGFLSIVFVFGTLGAKDIIGRSLSDRFLAYGSLTLCAAVCLFASGYVLIRRSRAICASAAGDLRPPAETGHADDDYMQTVPRP